MLYLVVGFVVGLSGGALATPSLDSNDSSRTISSYSMGEIESILVDFLSESYPSIEMGTPAFYNFLLNELLGDGDENLASHDNYSLIRAYLAEYKLIYEDYLLCESFIAENTIASNSALQRISLDTDSVLYNSHSNEVAFSVSDSFKSQTIADIQAKNLSNQTSNPRTSFLISPNAVSGYSGSAAASYAREYAYQPYNYPSYNYYLSDCTNFVSQCLAAGGLSWQGSPTSSGTVESTTRWYHKTFERELAHGGFTYSYGVTTSWVRVSDFLTYMRSRIGSSKAVTYYSKEDLRANCAVGDPVLLLNSDTNTAYHAVIITAKGSSASSTKYSGHTNDRRDEPITSFSNSDNYLLLKLAS